MFYTFREAWDIGLFGIPFNFYDAAYLAIPFWIFFILSALLQLLLMKKCSGFGRWIFMLFSAAGILGFDIATHFAVGWDMLLTLAGYGFFITLFCGALACVILPAIIRYCKSKKPNQQSGGIHANTEHRSK